jgi:hypothetical protein
MIDAIVKWLATLLPNHALQSALSAKLDTETIWVGPHEKTSIEVQGVCCVTLNTN